MPDEEGEDIEPKKEQQRTRPTLFSMLQLGTRVAVQNWREELQDTIDQEEEDETEMITEAEERLRREALLVRKRRSAMRSSALGCVASPTCASGLRDAAIAAVKKAAEEADAKNGGFDGKRRATMKLAAAAALAAVDGDALDMASMELQMHRVGKMLHSLKNDALDNEGARQLFENLLIGIEATYDSGLRGVRVHHRKSFVHMKELLAEYERSIASKGKPSARMAVQLAQLRSRVTDMGMGVAKQVETELEWESGHEDQMATAKQQLGLMKQGGLDETEALRLLESLTAGIDSTFDPGLPGIRPAQRWEFEQVKELLKEYGARLHKSTFSNQSELLGRLVSLQSIIKKLDGTLKGECGDSLHRRGPGVKRVSKRASRGKGASCNKSKRRSGRDSQPAVEKTLSSFQQLRRGGCDRGSIARPGRSASPNSPQTPARSSGEVCGFSPPPGTPIHPELNGRGLGDVEGSVLGGAPAQPASRSSVSFDENCRQSIGSKRRDTGRACMRISGREPMGGGGASILRSRRSSLWAAEGVLDLEFSMGGDYEKQESESEESEVSEEGEGGGDEQQQREEEAEAAAAAAAAALARLQIVKSVARKSWAKAGLMIKAGCRLSAAGASSHAADERRKAAQLAEEERWREEEEMQREAEREAARRAAAAERAIARRASRVHNAELRMEKMQMRMRMRQAIPPREGEELYPLRVVRSVEELIQVLRTAGALKAVIPYDRLEQLFGILNSSSVTLHTIEQSNWQPGDRRCDERLVLQVKELHVLIEEGAMLTDMLNRCTITPPTTRGCVLMQLPLHLVGSNGSKLVCTTQPPEGTWEQLWSEGASPPRTPAKSGQKGMHSFPSICTAPMLASVPRLSPGSLPQRLAKAGATPCRGIIIDKVSAPPQQLGIALAVAQLGVQESDVEDLGWSAEQVNGTIAEDFPTLHVYADLLGGVPLFHTRYTLRLRVRADALPCLRTFNTMEARRDGSMFEHSWRWAPGRRPQSSSSPALFR